MGMKRTLDLAVAFGGLVTLSPLMGAVALAILLTSGRPALFKQVRVGQWGRPFFIRKFRTMKAHTGTEAGLFEPGSLSRITPFGRVLRRTKLDELPQLWNVLMGEMSFVGPRPEVPRWVAEHPDNWKQVLTIRPGITDPASIVFRDEEAILARSPDPAVEYEKTILPRKLAIYENYVRTRTLIGDIGILAKTALEISIDVARRKF
jgi:lipopolysaccharide/colanic/teichoic acid biosynthesis glycosyltransferase